MKQHATLVGVAALLFLSFASYADEGEAHTKPLEVVLQQIRQAQGLKADERIDPDKVSEAKLEELGEAWMSVRHPAPKEHALMDEMMGGEGSANLAAMHRMMGYRYLSGGQGMMGQGRMGWGMTGGWWILGIIFWIALTAGIVVLIVWLIRTMVAPRKVEVSSLEILKRRYARGEISKEEFEEKKRDLS